MFGLVDFIRRKPVYKKKKKKKNYAVPSLRGRFLKSGRWGKLMKKDLEIFSFSPLSKAWGKPTDDVPEKQRDAILIIVLSGGVSLYRKRYVEGP